MITDHNKQFLIKFGKSEHREHALTKSNDPEASYNAAQSPLLDHAMQQKIIDSPDANKYAIRKLAMHSRIPTDSLVDTFLSMKREFTNDNNVSDVLENPNLNEHQIQKAIDHHSFNGHRHALVVFSQENASPKNISSALKKSSDPGFQLYMGMSHHKNLKVNDDVVATAIEKQSDGISSPYLRYALEKHYDDGKKEIPSHIIHKILDKDENHYQLHNFVLDHPEHLKSDHIHKIIDNDVNAFEQPGSAIAKAMKSPAFGQEHLDKVVHHAKEHPNEDVRAELGYVIKSHLRNKGIDENEFFRKHGLK